MNIAVQIYRDPVLLMTHSLTFGISDSQVTYFHDNGNQYRVEFRTTPSTLPSPISYDRLCETISQLADSIAEKDQRLAILQTQIDILTAERRDSYGKM